jgi:hypothetical protein
MKVFRSLLWALTVMLLTASCTSHPRRVDCEAHLKPINAPAPMTPSGDGP